MNEIPPVEQTQEALLEEFKILGREFRSTPSEQKAKFVQNNTERYMALLAKRRESSLSLVLAKLTPEDLELQDGFREGAKPIIQAVFENYGRYSSLTPEQIRQQTYFLPIPLFLEYANLTGTHKRVDRIVAKKVADLAATDGSGIVVFKAGKLKRDLDKGDFSEQGKYELIHSFIHTLQQAPPCPIGLLEESADYFATKMMPDVKRPKYPFQRLFRKMTRLIGEDSMEGIVFGKFTPEEAVSQSQLDNENKKWFLKQCSRLNVGYFSTYMWVIPPPKTVAGALYENILPC
jgi:hypothetical protein